MAENFPNLMDTTNLYIEETQHMLKHKKYEENTKAHKFLKSVIKRTF